MSEKEIQNHNEDGVKLYELGFNLVSSIAEGDLDTEFKNLKDIITKQGGVISSESKPELINLAYTISKMIDSRRSKYSQAYFGWVRFTIESSKLEDLKKEVELFPNMLRFLLITTKEEGGISASEVAKMINGEKSGEVSKDEEKEEEVEEEVLDEELNEEKEDSDSEVDEAIDELLEDSK